MPNNKAALYLRSSKDRSDVSIDAQRRELQKLATERGLLIVAEYSDVVLSGTEENRPGLQRMIAELSSRGRPWDVVLILDTSRLQRNRDDISAYFELDAEKRGVAVIYKSLPQGNEAMKVLIKHVYHGMDAWHSIISREKGLAGMAENVHKGFRAGGRAPRGYRLVKIQTGAVREGEPVTKSKLELDAHAELVATYLKQRALNIEHWALHTHPSVQTSVATNFPGGDGVERAYLCGPHSVERAQRIQRRQQQGGH